MPKFSVKKPLTILVATLAVVVLGVVAYLKMTPDLMPNMDFPYVILITSDPGASPEAIEQSAPLVGPDTAVGAVHGHARPDQIRHLIESGQRLDGGARV